MITGNVKCSPKKAYSKYSGSGFYSNSEGSSTEDLREGREGSFKSSMGAMGGASLSEGL